MDKGKKYGDLIKKEAFRLGFSFVGISKAEFLEEDARHLDTWLKAGYHGSMQYMENHFDKRLDPRLLVPGAKTVISLLYNYHTKQKQKDTLAPKISTYAYGTDYHFIVKDKLKSLFAYIRDEIGDVNGRVFIDSAPVMERSWAAKSGLGWIGKHSLLINKQQGSFFFLAELISDLDLPPDGPIKDYCGTCTRCIDACPTNAILDNHIVDAGKCISYLTIELKDDIPKEFAGKMNNWMFGCDVCQDVCPWNRFSKPHREPAFEPSEKLLNMNNSEWQELTQEVFNEIFKKSAVKRTKYRGLMRNIGFLEEKRN